MARSTGKHLAFYFLVLFFLFLLISGGHAGRRRKKKKKKSQDPGARSLQVDAEPSSSKSSNKKKSKSKYHESFKRVKHIGRAGIRPVQSITKFTTMKSPTTTTATTTTLPRKKSISKFRFPTTSSTTVGQRRSNVKEDRLLKPLQFNDAEIPASSSTNSNPPRDDMFPPTESEDSSSFILIPDHGNSTKTVAEYLPPSRGESNPYVCENKDKNRKQNVRLCGYPAVYNQTHCAEIYCSEAPLFMCENKVEMIVFGIVTLFLGLSIIIGNCLLPYVVYRRRNMRSHQNYIKVSLAFADMLIGILLVSSVLPNMFWIRSISEMGVVDAIEKETNAAVAVLAGSLLVVSFESSLLHLAFLAFERLLALNWSLRHRRLEASKIGYCLIGIWALSLLLAFTPAIFPDKFEYTILPILFVYMLTAKALPASDAGIPEDAVGYHGQLYGGLTMLFPYTLTVIFCVLTGIVVRRKLRKSSSPALTNSDLRFNPSSTGSAEVARLPLRMTPSYATELMVFKTLLIMITAFSFTILPIVIVLVLYNTNSDLSCENYSLAYTIAYFASISNSLVNVLIYTARDGRFRKGLVSELPSICKGNNLRKVQKRKQEVYSTSMNVF